ncbi:MAG: class I SAM-dependent methyltransferase [Bacteroidota bacterium]
MNIKDITPPILFRLFKKGKGIVSFFNGGYTFTKLKNRETIYLYAGDVPDKEEYKRYIGLSLSQKNNRHIQHDVTKKYPLPDNCVSVYQSEDVFEHIPLAILPTVINEIYRVLKPGGVFRLSIPDYRCNILNDRTLKDKSGELTFDPVGGGAFKDGKVVEGGHVWFPKYEIVKNMLEKTLFKKILFYHYYNEMGEGITNKIDYSVGYVQRTPDHDERVRNPYRPMSIVVDCIKD